MQSSSMNSGANSSLTPDCTLTVRSPSAIAWATAAAREARVRIIQPPRKEQAAPPMTSRASSAYSATSAAATRSNTEFMPVTSSCCWNSRCAAIVCSQASRAGMTFCTRCAKAWSRRPASTCSTTRPASCQKRVLRDLTSLNRARPRSVDRELSKVSARSSRRCASRPMSARVACSSSGVRARMAWRACSEMRVSVNSISDMRSSCGVSTSAARRDSWRVWSISRRAHADSTAPSRASAASSRPSRAAMVR